MTAVVGQANRRQVDLFGTAVDALTYEESIERLFALAADPRPSQHVVLNASKVVQMEKDPKLREIVAGCDMINADGISIVWASRLLGTPVPERVTGIDLFYGIVSRARETGHRLYFLGATDEVLQRMISRFEAELPGITIAGYRNGYWDEAEVGQVIDEVVAATPDFLFLAIPSPRKEYWLHDHLSELRVPVVMGVGGSFDVMAGLVQRAPAWVQRLGCEWLYRLVQEPKRMWKRYLFGNLEFMRLTRQAMKQQRATAARNGVGSPAQ